MGKYVTKSEFDIWANDWFFKYIHRPDNDTRLVVSHDKNVVTICNPRTGKIATAKCHKDDTFDYYVGAAIAYARYCGYEVPTVIEDIDDDEIKKIVKLMHSMECETVDELVRDVRWLKNYVKSWTGLSNKELVETMKASFDNSEFIDNIDKNKE